MMNFFKRSSGSEAGPGVAEVPGGESTSPAAAIQGSGHPGPPSSNSQGPPFAPGEAPPDPGSVDPNKAVPGSTPAPGTKTGEEPKPLSAEELLAGKYTSTAELAQGYTNLLTESTKLKAEMAALRAAPPPPVGTAASPPGPATPTNGKGDFAAYRKNVSALIKEAGSEMGEESLGAFTKIFELQDQHWQDQHQATSKTQAAFAAQQELRASFDNFYATNPVAKHYKKELDAELMVAMSKPENDLGYYQELMLGAVRAKDITNIVKAAIKEDRETRGAGTSPIARNLMAGPAGGGGTPSPESEAAALISKQQWGK